ncbi:hypothetical protein NL676_011160 [Syzygium grande]|nr:hypothetical protein NL676_011160 [Syzygium grande]
MSSIDTLLSSKAFYAKPRVGSNGLCPIPIISRRGLERSSSVRGIRLRAGITRRFFKVSCESSSDSAPPKGDDFVARVLKENPSQAEPKYLVGDKFYTLKEKENLSKNADVGLFEILRRALDKRGRLKRGSDEGQNKAEAAAKEESVYLKDILREYRGNCTSPSKSLAKSCPRKRSSTGIWRHCPR